MNDYSEKLKNFMDAIQDYKKSYIKHKNAVIGGNWFLYGSKKSPESKPYSLTYIIEEKRPKVSNIMTPHELIFLLSVRQKTYTKINKLSFVPEIPERLVKIFDFDNHTKRGEDELRNLIEKIPKNIAEDYLTWRPIGCAIFNETHGEDYGREIFKIFSQKSPEKYDEDVCDIFWEKMTDANYSIGTIIFYTQEKPKIKKYL